MKKRALLVIMLLIAVCNATLGQETAENESKLAYAVSLYYKGENAQKFYDAIHKYRDFVEANQRTHDYFALWKQEIYYDIQHNHYRNALKKTEQLKDELKDRDAEPYYYLIDYLMGMFYGMREENQLAKQHLLQAIKLAEPENDSAELLAIYQMLTNISIFKHLEEELVGYSWADQAVRLSQTPEDRCASLSLKSMVAFGHVDRTTFEKCYADITRIKRENPDKQFTKYSKYVALCRAAYDGDYDRAVQLCDSIADEVGRYYFLATIYEVKGDVAGERDALLKLLKAKDRRNNEISTLTVSDINQDFQLEHQRYSVQKAQIYAQITRIVVISLAVVLCFVILYLILRRRWRCK